MFVDVYKYVRFVTSGSPDHIENELKSVSFLICLGLQNTARYL